MEVNGLVFEVRRIYSFWLWKLFLCTWYVYLLLYLDIILIFQCMYYFQTLFFYTCAVQGRRDCTSLWTGRILSWNWTVLGYCVDYFGKLYWHKWVYNNILFCIENEIDIDWYQTMVFSHLVHIYSLFCVQLRPRWQLPLNSGTWLVVLRSMLLVPWHMRMLLLYPWMGWCISASLM